METKIIEFVKGLATIFLYFAVAKLGLNIFNDFTTSNNLILATLAQLAPYILIMITLCLIYHKRLIKDFKNFKKENIKIAIVNWLIGFAFMMIFNIILNKIIGTIPSNESANRTILLEYPIASIISMIFIGPFIEEITFRASFKNAFNKWYTFALATSFLFGFAHILNSTSLIELLYILPYGALGFFLAKAFYETDNIYTSFIAHMSHNAICVGTIILLGAI